MSLHELKKMFSQNRNFEILIFLNLIIWDSDAKCLNYVFLKERQLIYLS